MSNTRSKAYDAAKTADDAFELAIEKQFGTRDAGDMRYRSDLHNTETSAARIAYQNACESLRQAFPALYEGM